MRLEGERDAAKKKWDQDTGNRDLFDDYIKKGNKFFGHLSAHGDDICAKVQ